MDTKKYFVNKKVFMKPKGDFYNYYINNNMLTHPDFMTIYNYYLKKYHNINNWWWHEYPKDWENHPDSFPVPIYWWLYPDFPYISDQYFFDHSELIPKTDHTEYIDYIDSDEHFESSNCDFQNDVIYMLIILIVACLIYYLFCTVTI